MNAVMISIIVGIGTFILGAIIGAVVGSSAVTRETTVELQDRLADEKRRSEMPSKHAEMRVEKRARANYIPVNVRAPVFDSVGLPLAGEEISFIAQLLDISSRGAAILAQNFVPKGATVDVACKQLAVNFEYRQAMVMNIVLTPHGVRIGLRFLIPLEGYSAFAHK